MAFNFCQRFQRRSKKKYSVNQKPWLISWFSEQPEKHILVENLRSCFLSSFVEFVSAVSEELKISLPIRGQGGLLGITIGPKNKNMVEDVEICFLSSFVEFHSVVFPFGCFRDQVSAN